MFFDILYISDTGDKFIVEVQNANLTGLNAGEIEKLWYFKKEDFILHLGADAIETIESPSDDCSIIELTL